MPDGLPNLPPPLTAPSLAALLPSPALLELLRAMQPPAGMIPPPGPPPPRPPRSVNELLPEITERLSAAAPATTPPFVPPAPSQPGGLQAWLPAIARVLATLGSPQPAQTAAGFLSEDAQRADLRRREQIERERQIDERRAGEQQFLQRTALTSAIRQADEERATFQAYGEEQRKEERSRETAKENLRYQKELDKFRTDENIREAAAKAKDEYGYKLQELQNTKPALADTFRMLAAEDELVKGGMEPGLARIIVDKRVARAPLTPVEDRKAATAQRRFHLSLHPGRSSSSGQGGATSLLSGESLLKARLAAIETRARDLQNDPLIEIEDAQGNKQLRKEIPGMIERIGGQERIRGAKSFRRLSDAEKFQLADEFRQQQRANAAGSFYSAPAKRPERPVETPKTDRGKTVTMAQIRATAKRMRVGADEAVRRARAAGYQVVEEK